MDTATIDLLSSSHGRKDMPDLRGTVAEVLLLVLNG